MFSNKGGDVLRSAASPFHEVTRPGSSDRKMEASWIFWPLRCVSWWSLIRPCQVWLSNICMRWILADVQLEATY
ncbi:hypothetical protein ROHU_031594 [Labeo rohita]|uniref:Uncharacterized protein n=1 Tax=Labeo rohita TaxID=84645 RepID=A0A498LTL1_LABRO|nr:hypothetical protein ROHU_031594 [Labeo rohita]